MSLIKLLATLGLLLSRQTAADPAEHTVPVVNVPFGCGLQFEISQAHNVGSHLDNDIWAWDFRMPEGVPIVAAKGGVVRMARGDSTEGGCDPKYAKDANYVVVDHGDGTEAQYLHFSSVVVEAGQKVNQGELLGYSGKTGWACGSHLHFKIAQHVHNGWNNPSIPAAIEGYGDPQVDTVIHAPACSNKAPEVIQADATHTQTQPQVQTAAATVDRSGFSDHAGIGSAAAASLVDHATVTSVHTAAATGPTHAGGGDDAAVQGATAPTGLTDFGASANAAKAK